MKKVFGFLLLIAVQLPLLLSCSNKTEYEYPFQNPKLSNEARVDNLISLLTPEEKVGLMMNKAISVDRLGIPSYNWWSEACHGVRYGGYTVYPQPVGMASSFNPELFYEVFDTVSDEARANWNRSDHDIFNVGLRANYVPGNPELTFWCPNINIFRDPRWGRGQETCGEDPYLTSILGVQTVLGMQGNDKKYFKTHACAKHYAVHSGPEPLRHSFDAVVSMRDLWETYLPAFKALVVEGHVQEVMCAYNRYEGEPCCGSDRLLTDILRNKWGYEDIILTDCDAINNFYNKNQHGTHPDAVSASVDAILSGTDLECGNAFVSLQEALDKGLISEADLDVHLRRTLLGRFELGMFDPADANPWANLGEDVISSEAHDALARQAARESLVLLKNNGVLPLNKSAIKKLAVIGPNADDVSMMNGNYGGTPTEEHQRSILDGFKEALPNAEIFTAKACEIMDEYSTTYHIPDFNNGQGFFVEFFNNRNFAGKPVASGYYKQINFSTFGAYGFAEGVERENMSVRITGKYTPDFTGPMSYSVSSDGTFKFTVNGRTVEQTRPGDAAPARRGFGRNAMPTKTFDVVAGKPIDVKIEYVQGTGSFAMLNAEFCERKLAEFSDLAAQVKDADAIVIVGGISARFEGEGGDRSSMDLPVVQQRLLKAMHATGKPVIFISCSGSAIGFGAVQDQYDALLQAWYAGQGGAQAIADVVFGDYNPSGKLPVTFYTGDEQLPDFMDYNMEGRTYKYFHGTPLYAFGYGLSYTTFEYGKAKLSKSSIKAGKSVTITVPVKNTGNVAGEEVVQVYVKSLDNPDAPIKSLKGFQKVNIEKGATSNVKITLGPGAFEYYDASIDELSVFPGNYKILYGSSSRDEDLQSLDLKVL
ncbi:MAG: glycoside hydrolase family 3 C-terminal domain-containing protein [Bacteroidales bacterium]|nr:glycoside hydrolase family 3 C-terminal domain-containing protein [Bacteroidales bacterium]